MASVLNLKLKLKSIDKTVIRKHDNIISKWNV